MELNMNYDFLPFPSLLSLTHFFLVIHFFFSSWSRMHMLFYILVDVVTNIPKSSSLIWQFYKSNKIFYHWLTHILSTLISLCFKSSTSKTFVSFTCSVPWFTTPFPGILTKELSPNATLMIFIFRLLNLFLSSIKCVEQPLSMYCSSYSSSTINVRLQSSSLYFSHIIVGFSIFNMIGAFYFINLYFFALWPRLLHLWHTMFWFISGSNGL